MYFVSNFVKNNCYTCKLKKVKGNYRVFEFLIIYQFRMVRVVEDLEKWDLVEVNIFQISSYVRLEKVIKVRIIRIFGEYYKEIDCQGKIVQVLFVLRVMRNRKETIFKSKLIEVVIKGKDKINVCDGL